jgi:hypothetical protein
MCRAPALAWYLSKRKAGFRSSASVTSTTTVVRFSELKGNIHGIQPSLENVEEQKLFILAPKLMPSMTMQQSSTGETWLFLTVTSLGLSLSPVFRIREFFGPSGSGFVIICTDPAPAPSTSKT